MDGLVQNMRHKRTPRGLAGDHLEAITQHIAIPQTCPHAVMADLSPVLTVQVAVRLTAITLRLTVKILQIQPAIAQDPDICEAEQQELSEVTPAASLNERSLTTNGKG